jgi:hypothetical protein
MALMILMGHNSAEVVAKEEVSKIRLFQRSKWKIMDGAEWD